MTIIHYYIIVCKIEHGQWTLYFLFFIRVLLKQMTHRTQILSHKVHLNT